MESTSKIGEISFRKYSVSLDDEPKEQRIMRMTDIDKGLSDQQFGKAQIELWQEVEQGKFTLHESEVPEGFTVENIDMNNIVNPIIVLRHTADTLQELVSPIAENMSLFLVIPVLLIVSKTIFKQIYDLYQNYDTVAYNKAVNTLRLFSEYKSFTQSTRWWLWRSRWSHAAEINRLFQVIADSPYKTDPFYQFEIIQLLPQKRTLNKLIKEKNLHKVTKQIEQLNQTFWSVEF